MSNFIKLVGQRPRTVLIPRPLGGAVPHRLIMLTKLLSCPVAEIVLRSMRNITQVRNLRALVVNYRLTEWFAK